MPITGAVLASPIARSIGEAMTSAASRTAWANPADMAARSIEAAAGMPATVTPSTTRENSRFAFWTIRGANPSASSSRASSRT